ncbi:MAG: hypothetical protein ACTSR8_15565 [Promethearchaeota archaeon]
MVIREAGLLFRGFTLVNGLYHQTSDDHVDKDLRSGLLTALLNFAESAFAAQDLEYFEGNRFVIAFTQDKISSRDSVEPELFIAYAILDKEKKIDKHIKKVVIPQLQKIISKFKTQYEGKNLSEISQFANFKSEVNKAFGSDTKTIDQKLNGVFF